MNKKTKETIKYIIMKNNNNVLKIIDKNLNVIKHFSLITFIFVCINILIIYAICAGLLILVK